jgi:hypothetical protein
MIYNSILLKKAITFKKKIIFFQLIAHWGVVSFERGFLVGFPMHRVLRAFYVCPRQRQFFLYQE